MLTGLWPVLLWMCLVLSHSRCPEDVYSLMYCQGWDWQLKLQASRLRDA